MSRGRAERGDKESQAGLCAVSIEPDVGLKPMNVKSCPEQEP